MSTNRYDRPGATSPARHRAPCPTSRPHRGTALRRHLRLALTGTLLAVVAVTGLSAYADQGVADARQNAPCQARIPSR